MTFFIEKNPLEVLSTHIFLRRDASLCINWIFFVDVRIVFLFIYMCPPHFTAQLCANTQLFGSDTSCACARSPTRTRPYELLARAFFVMAIKKHFFILYIMQVCCQLFASSGPQSLLKTQHCTGTSERQKAV